MSTGGFFITFLSWYIILPAVLLCYAPMGSRLRCRKPAYVIIGFGILFLLIITAFIASSFSLSSDASFFFIILSTFFIYHISLSVSICKSLSIYALVFALIFFLKNYANGFDAYLHPTSTLNNFSLEAALFQAILVTLATAILFIPVKKYGGSLIDRFDIEKVWYTTLPISGIFLIYNLLISPRRYETIHTNLVWLFYWVSLSLLLALLFLLCILFYFIVSGMMEAAETQERNRILEMQESHYSAQQRYIDETARVRHDFKHTIAALNELASDGNIEAVKSYLNNYLASQPKSDIRHFCPNPVVNAVLNYYMQLAAPKGIKTDWEINMPKGLSIQDTDLCGIIGNILENAILACDGIPENERFIDFIIRISSDNRLFILCANSFDGKVREHNGLFLPVRKGSGHGIGLKSIASTAEKYGGIAQFKYENREFYTDVVLPVKIE